MFSSRGANAILAIRSHIIQKTAPPRKVPGMMISGLDVPKLLFIRNGTAIPTKEIGPAKAVILRKPGSWSNGNRIRAGTPGFLT